MSEPVSNSEIEDVLSSIRRLVSEDVRPEKDADSAQKTPRFSHTAKLVLTPALRVAEGTQDAAGASQPDTDLEHTPKVADGESVAEGKIEAEVASVSEPEREPEPKPESETAADAEAQPQEAASGQGRLERTIAELEAAIAAQDIDWEPDGSEEAELVEAALTPVPSERSDTSEQVSSTDEPQAATEDAAQISTPHDDPVERQPHEPEAEYQQESTAQPAETEDEAHAPEPVARQPAGFRITPAVTIDETPAEAGPDALAEARDSAADSERDMTAPEAAAPETEIESVEQVIEEVRPAASAPTADSRDFLEAEDIADAEDVPAAEEVIEAEDAPAVEELIEAEDAAAVEDVIETEEAFFSEDAAVIDEETLRDMVSEIVRGELQGDLGQRITRNVRKLVRREIHRALASRDFD